MVLVHCPRCDAEVQHYARGLCKKHFVSDWQKRHRRKIRARIYGTTVKEINRLRKLQQGKCALCRTDLVDNPRHNRGRNKMCIDHDHTSGRVRGLLCDVCNRGLGFYERMIEFPNLQAYLEGRNELVEKCDVVEDCGGDRCEGVPSQTA